MFRGARIANSSTAVEGASMLTGKTTLIAHLGYPTEAFTAPMIYNPWFERAASRWSAQS